MYRYILTFLNEFAIFVCFSNNGCNISGIWKEYYIEIMLIVSLFYQILECSFSFQRTSVMR